MESDVDVRRIFPEDQTQSLPPLPWENEVQNNPTNQPTTDQPPALTGNGTPYPSNERFEVLKNELSFDNDDAFREVVRLPLRQGRGHVRLTQSRKFWAGLQRMSEYWDTSLDHYFERPKTPEQLPADGVQAHEDQIQTDDDSSHSTSGLSGTAMDVDKPQIHEVPTGSPSKKGARPSVAMYTGRRLGAGSEMPDDIRDDTVRAFVEMVAWPFGCQVTVPITGPRLTIKTLLFPVRRSFQAVRCVRDRQGFTGNKISAPHNGIMEGPVLIAQCRSETSFRTAQDTPGFGTGEACDLLREVGGMLLAAQERAREGTAEQRPGEGKWWTMTPRFGGAAHDGVLDDHVNKGHGTSLPDTMLEESKPSSEEPEVESARKRHKYEHPFLTALSRRPSAMRKLSSSEKWKIVQPGTSLWDKRMTYMQVGRAKESPFDDVCCHYLALTATETNHVFLFQIYMVSSINHHIAILHLRIHRRYLDILSTGDSGFLPDSNIPDQPWHVLKLQRTRWFDLLDASDRVEALKGVWSLFHYQLRKT